MAKMEAEGEEAEEAEEGAPGDGEDFLLREDGKDLDLRYGEGLQVVWVSG